MATKVPAV